MSMSPLPLEGCDHKLSGGCFNLGKGSSEHPFPSRVKSPAPSGLLLYLHNSMPALIGACHSGQASRASRLSSDGSVMPSAESSAIFWLRTVIRSQSCFDISLGLVALNESPGGVKSVFYRFSSPGRTEG